MTRKRIAILTTVGLFIAVSVICTPIVKFIIGMHLHFKRTEAKQARILYETDHEALLEACREMMKDPEAYSLGTEWQKADSPDGPEADDPRQEIPAIIRDLDPVYIDVSDDSVYLKFHGGHWHWGLYAFPERLVANPPWTGNVELIPGLWFYDNEYLPGNTDQAIQKLKRLKPRDAPEPSWWKPRDGGQCGVQFLGGGASHEGYSQGVDEDRYRGEPGCPRALLHQSYLPRHPQIESGTPPPSL